jgi:hypothetical protein
VRAGVPLSAMDNLDGTITDNATGLTWELKDDAGGIHDKDNVYSWGQTLPPYMMNGTMVTEFLQELNRPPCFAGHCNWRIPNVRELQSLVDYQLAEPAVRTAFNRNCVPGCSIDGVDGPKCSCTAVDRPTGSARGRGTYWSCTTSRYISDNPALRSGEFNAWVVDFSPFADLPPGASYVDLKVQTFYVRAVRGGFD